MKICVDKRLTELCDTGINVLVVGFDFHDWFISLKINRVIHHIPPSAVTGRVPRFPGHIPPLARHSSVPTPSHAQFPINRAGRLPPPSTPLPGKGVYPAPLHDTQQMLAALEGFIPIARHTWGKLRFQ